MNKKISFTLLVAMFSLLIIGFGGTATAEAAGNCAETLLVNVSASESTALINCRAFEADAARYNAMAAFYTNETNVQRAFEADAARYTSLAAFYTAETAGKCLGIASTDLTAVEFVNCLSDSAYQAANPELMTSHRFVVAEGSATSQPVSNDIEALRQRIYSDWVIESEAVDVSILGQATQGNVTSQPVSVDIEVLQNLILDRNYFHPGR